ncbi:HAD-IA family hydrolase, partial [Bacteroides gallinaceum]|uniref:HAD-IA family hydrolase n=1 Tax=Bacteroides gallinaceum TaxID=1462571 RepID=UPI0025A34548
MKTYQTYLFDFDYTLADSSKGIVMCYRNVLERHGHTGISDEQIKRTIGKTLVDSFAILSGITDTDTLEIYRKEYVKEADKYMTANTRLFPETAEVLTRLKAQGAKIGIISTKYRYRIMELLGHALPQGTIDLIVGGEDVQTPKPSPEGVFIALEKLHTEKASTLYIGDSIVDAETAQAAGTDFAGVLHGTTTREELAAYPHTDIMNDLTALLS